MKALAIIGIFFGLVAVGVIAMFWLIGATTPDQSHLTEQVEVTVVDATKETRASSSNRYGHRVQYLYQFGGTTYVDDQFVSFQRWEPGLPLRLVACVDPDSAARHALQVNPQGADTCDGSYVGTEQTATPRQRSE